MNTLHKVLFMFMAVVLAGFALSANAAKTITLTNVPAALSTNTTQIQLTLNNTGNSNASSLELDWTDTTQFTVISGTINTNKGPITATPVTGQTPGNYRGLQFTFTLPQKTSVVIALDVRVAAGSTCGAPQITWQPYAWTGGVGTPSTSFSQLALGTYTSNLPSDTNCALSFATQPADAFVGSVITSAPFNSAGAPVTVIATHDGSFVSGVNVAIGATAAPGAPGGCTVSGSATTESSGTATFTSLSSSAAGTDCQLTATATGFTPATSNAFNVEPFLSTLDCSPNAGSTFGGLASLFISPTSSTVPPTAPTADWGLLRGVNRTGTCPFKVPFTFTLENNNSALFTEDSLGQETSVEYIIRWAPVDVDGDTWSARQPCVAWGVADPDPGSDLTVCGGDYVPALACLKDDVNAPGDGTGEVMPDIPYVLPFSGFTSNDHPQYRPTSVTGLKAKVCVSQQGWTSFDGQVQYWTKVIDQSDAGIRLP